MKVANRWPRWPMALQTAFNAALRAVCDLEATLDVLESYTGRRYFSTPDGKALWMWARSVRVRETIWFEYRLAKLLIERERARRGR